MQSNINDNEYTCSKPLFELLVKMRKAQKVAREYKNRQAVFAGHRYGEQLDKVLETLKQTMTPELKYRLKWMPKQSSDGKIYYFCQSPVDLQIEYDILFTATINIRNEVSVRVDTETVYTGKGRSFNDAKMVARAIVDDMIENVNKKIKNNY